MTTALGRKEPLTATAQPVPINSWACDLGRWLPSTARERARLGAEPLLWPISERDSLMLYAVALAA